jgi:hypothetical protein
MNTNQTYLDLITSEYVNQPDFNATVNFMVSIQVWVQSLMSSMLQLFYLGTPPVGNQLDIVGQWVGVSRVIAIPIQGNGIYFTWDDTQFDGWDFGTWQPNTGPATITILPDDAYLTLILARIAANNWDGTTEGAYKIWRSLFPGFTILIDDNENMSYQMAIIGGIVDSLTLALLTGGYIPLRPEGVEITNYYVSVDTNPAFAWDVENTNLKGWNQGSWLRNLP